MDGLNQDAKLLERHSSQLLEHLQFKQKGSLVKDNPKAIGYAYITNKKILKHHFTHRN